MWKRCKTIGIWLLTLALTLSFLPTGYGKFTDPGWAEAFAAWGYPAGAHYAVGLLEMAAAALLLAPRLASPAASGLAVLMLGALLTHAVHGNHPTFPAAQMAAVYLVMAAILAYARRGVSRLRRQS
ncbi:MAG: DoxX family protein [Acidobacteriota bacterium]